MNRQNSVGTDESRSNALFHKKSQIVFKTDHNPIMAYIFYMQLEASEFFRAHYTGIRMINEVKLMIKVL